MSQKRLREFLYVDVDRVRSLLAQLEGGVLEEVRAEGGNTLEAEAQARIFGIGGRGGYSHESRTEESRSLQDITFAIFEDAADAQGWIFELDDSFSDSANWHSGRVHGRLQPGMLVRITCPLQLLDGGLFRSRVARLDKMADALVELNAQPNTSPTGGTNRARQNQAQAKKAAAKSLIFGQGFPIEMLEAIPNFVDAFLGESIAVRVAPCGLGQLECGFSGSLLGRDEYIQRERESLFSRYGAKAATWTSVLQIAAVPSEDTSSSGSPQPAQPPNVASASGSISRAAMEGMAGGLLEVMEQIGVVEGPRWPSVSATPLGVYRNVPSVP